MARSTESQSLFLREQRQNQKRKRAREGLEYQLQIPFHSRFMRHYLSRQVDGYASSSPCAYETVLTEKKVHHPINFNEEIVTLIQSLLPGLSAERDKAYSIFQWIVGNVAYDHDKKKLIDQSEGKPIPYRSAVQTFQERKGVCGEMANLNVALARIAKMKANYASVSQLEDGNKVVHACAAVYVKGAPILSDPAMKQFDVKHRQYEIIDDINLEQKMRAWNHGAA